MKIRIKGNSLRYRLTQTDMAVFAQNGYLEEKITFGGKSLVYAVKRYHDNELTATFNDNLIVVNVPALIADEWTSTDRIGFEKKNGPLYLLIEKDFKCLDNVEEDQSDNYPNPRLL